MFLGKPESAVCAQCGNSGGISIPLGRSEPLPPQKCNTTLVLEVLERRLKSSEIGRASRHDATEEVFCCVCSGFAIAQVPLTALYAKWIVSEYAVIREEFGF
jgi:hypothetical protein